MLFPLNKMIMFKIGLLEQNLKQTILSVHPVRTDRQTKNLKDRSLMSYFSNRRTFKIGLLEQLLEQTDNFVCLSVYPFVRTDGQTKSTKGRSLMSYLSNKKRNFKIRRLQLV